MTYTLAISGITNPPDAASALAKNTYRSLAHKVERKFGQPSAIMSGCQFGVDTDLVRFLIECWQDIEDLILVAPGAPHNFEFVTAMLTEGPAGMRVKVVRLLSHPDNATAYLARNSYLAEYADMLAAAPNTRHQVLRSGTWSTIRRFWWQQKQVIIQPFNGGFS